MKPVCPFRPAKGPLLANAALGDEPTPNDPFVIGEFRHLEVRFDRVPLRLECGIMRELRFDVIVFVTCANQRFVMAMLNQVLVAGNRALGSLTWQRAEAD
jgi:hypothetical protein